VAILVELLLDPDDGLEGVALGSLPADVVEPLVRPSVVPEVVLLVEVW